MNCPLNHRNQQKHGMILIISIFNEQINITECYQPSFKLFQITGLPPFVIIWVKYLPCSVIYKSPGSWYALSWKVNDTILRNIFTLVKQLKKKKKKRRSIFMALLLIIDSLHPRNSTLQHFRNCTGNSVDRISRRVPKM